MEIVGSVFSSGRGMALLDPASSRLVFVILCLMLCYCLAQWLRLSRARKRLVSTVARMAEAGRVEIGGQPVEHWLSVLNKNSSWPIAPVNATVLTYQGHNFFFIDGMIVGTMPISRAYSNPFHSALLLLAVGRSAVSLLSAQNHVFRRLSGSADLAVFSIFRWSHFADMLDTIEEP